MLANPTRDAIVEAADQLFYRRGFEYTSFADIADAVGISRGNFYYHFKSKDDILSAVIEARVAKTKSMLDEWEAGDDHPRSRIRSFIQILLRNLADIKRYGCPVGTLNAELAKLGHASKAEATALFAMFRVWLRKQFDRLGCGDQSDALAMHLLGRSQGVAALAHAFRDETFVQQEVIDLCRWLDALPDRPPTRQAAPRRRGTVTPPRSKKKP